MMNIDSNLEINGTSPDLIGRNIRTIICEQFWYNNKLEDSANVIHILIGENWFRLYFDCGIIFWRENSSKPKSYNYIDEDGNKVEHKLHDLLNELELNSPLITSINAKEIVGGCEVEFIVDKGVAFRFLNVDDTSSYST